MPLRLSLLVLVLVSSLACDPSLVIEAQTLPSAVHVTWSPNPASDAVTAYVVVLDGGAPQAVPLSACTATSCVASVSVPTAGGHSVTVAAQNLALSADPTSVQTGPASSAVSFTLNLVPAKAATPTIGK